MTDTVTRYTTDIATATQHAAQSQEAAEQATKLSIEAQSAVTALTIRAILLADFGEIKKVASEHPQAAMIRRTYDAIRSAVPDRHHQAMRIAIIKVTSSEPGLTNEAATETSLDEQTSPPTVDANSGTTLQSTT